MKKYLDSSGVAVVWAAANDKFQEKLSVGDGLELDSSTSTVNVVYATEEDVDEMFDGSAASDISVLSSPEPESQSASGSNGIEMNNLKINY